MITTEAEQAAERELRRAAARAGIALPLIELAGRFRLDRTEQDALLLVATAELDRAYERVYAYIMDNLNQRLPSVELLCCVLAGMPAGQLGVRRRLGPAGPLRRYGLLVALPADGPGRTAELVLAPGLFDLLLGTSGDADQAGTAGDAGLIGHDPGEVVVPAGYVVPPQLEPARLARLGRALAAGQIDLAGLWGAGPAGQLDVALALAGHAGRPLRTLLGRPGGVRGGGPDGGSGGWPGGGAEELAAATRTAAMLGAVLWIPADELRDTTAAAAVTELLTRTRIPVILTGTVPWRPAGLLAARAYAELDIPAATYQQRREAWSAVLPEVDQALLADLAVRYRIGGDELRAVAAVADAGARFAGNGRPAPLAEHVRPAVDMVTRGRTTGYARASAPRRTLDDLVLPPEQYRHIRQIAAAFRGWPQVAEAWGFGRRPGDAGVKVLFTGEPGTGKTLSAEILAGTLGMELVTVDLSQVVSKWVGETEKNLDTAFRQAEQSQALLLFDEADSLFGKRGEVRHGTDRYANLEVGYLLQRLESSDALVILASNLRENIDAAFTRRFHFVLNFSRPGPAERRRLWRLAFPAQAPLAADVDVEALSRLDMTGAGIASAARNAALIATESGTGTICMRDVVAGIARQYQREARLLRPAELGRYADLLAEAPPDRSS